MCDGSMRRICPALFLLLPGVPVLAFAALFADLWQPRTDSRCHYRGLRRLGWVTGHTDRGLSLWGTHGCAGHDPVDRARGRPFIFAWQGHAWVAYGINYFFTGPSTMQFTEIELIDPLAQLSTQLPGGRPRPQFYSFVVGRDLFSEINGTFELLVNRQAGGGGGGGAGGAIGAVAVRQVVAVVGLAVLVAGAAVAALAVVAVVGLAVLAVRRWRCGWRRWRWRWSRRWCRWPGWCRWCYRWR